MDQRDVALNGLNALAGATTAMGPAAGPLALLGLSVAGILALYGGSTSAPSPSLTADQIEKVVEHNLLKQDVRDAWALISPAHDWYRRWTVRAKGGEQFSASDLADFDTGFQQMMGPRSGLKSGLTKLYSGTANIDSTPGQFGVPYLIVGVGLYVQLLELDVVRTVERGEEVSPGEWQNLVGDLRHWSQGLEACDRLAHYRVEESVRTKLARDPAVKPGSAAAATLVREAEIVYQGGASADGAQPAIAAIGKIEAMLRTLQAAGHE